MHPRNRYRDNPPDFKKLAIKYEEFRKHCKFDVTGKVRFNFKDPEAVRVLAKCLLQSDFNLDVDLPTDCLVPRLPLRLNYLLWIDDLIADLRVGRVKGVDVGTGASCVYPLLGATELGWNFLATERDPQTAEVARRNVEQNGLADRIQVLTVPADVALSGPVIEALEITATSDRLATFTMCNPPFYDADECPQMDGQTDTDKSRPPPHSATVARSTEVSTTGGEVSFVRQMIADSVILGGKIRIFSTMLGKKSSVAPLKSAIREAGAKRLTETTLVQGKTLRWALAWTFCDDVIFKKSPKGKEKPFVIELPALTEDQMKTNLMDLLAELQIEVEATSTNSFQCTARIDTWSKQRQRKRRAAALDTDVKRQRCDASVSTDDVAGIASTGNLVGNDIAGSTSGVVGASTTLGVEACSNGENAFNVNVVGNAGNGNLDKTGSNSDTRKPAAGSNSDSATDAGQSVISNGTDQLEDYGSVQLDHASDMEQRTTPASSSLADGQTSSSSADTDARTGGVVVEFAVCICAGKLQFEYVGGQGRDMLHRVVQRVKNVISV